MENPPCPWLFESVDDYMSRIDLIPCAMLPGEEGRVQPTDVFNEPRFILTKFNGVDTCWLFIGEPERYGSARRKAWIYGHPGNPNAQGLGFACGTKNCIHPDHLYSGKSEIGKMFEVRANSKGRGSCRLWTGTLRDGRPHIRGWGTGNYSWVSVRRFVYEQEYNVQLELVQRVRARCKNADLCVAPKHLTLSKIAVKKVPDIARPRCKNNLHNIRTGRVTCHVCKV